jgi:hypothetical protein
VEQSKAASVAARKDFGTWHLWSLLLNMVTIGLVTVAMALAAQLPGDGKVVANVQPKSSEQVPAAAV